MVRIIRSFYRNLLFLNIISVYIALLFKLSLPLSFPLSLTYCARHHYRHLRQTSSLRPSSLQRLPPSFSLTSASERAARGILAYFFVVICPRKAQSPIYCLRRTVSAAWSARRRAWEGSTLAMHLREASHSQRSPASRRSSPD